MVKNEKEHTRSRVLEKMAERNGSRHPVYWSDSSKEPQSKCKYTGEWKDGKRHGYGVLIYSNGDKYEGEWEKNLRQGKGTFWESGKHTLHQKYTGEWKRDRMHGFGVFFYSQREKYEGYWSHDKRHGIGRMEYSDHVSSHTSKADIATIYDGAWYDDQRSGQGVHILPNGDRYHGSWNADQKEGAGKYYYNTTNRIYVGEWIDGTPKCGTYENGTDENKITTLSYSSKLPKLELVDSQRILCESVKKIRRERSGQRMSVCGHDEKLVTDNALTQNESVQLPEELFDRSTIDRLKDSFLRIQVSEMKNGIGAKQLEQLAQSIEMQFDAYRAHELMDDVGITDDTVLTFPECVEMLSLLDER